MLKQHSVVLPPVSHQTVGAPLSFVVATMGIFLPLGLPAAQPRHRPGAVRTFRAVIVKTEEKVVEPRPLVLNRTGRVGSLPARRPCRRARSRDFVVLSVSPIGLEQVLAGRPLHDGGHVLHLLLEIHGKVFLAGSARVYPQHAVEERPDNLQPRVEVTIRGQPIDLK